MLLTIIIPTFERTQLLAQCLELLGPQVAKHAQAVEVLICDDGSSEETRAMIAARFPGVNWLRGPKRGPAANRNAGAKIARGTWLAFLDDDCLPSETYLQAYLEAVSQAAGEPVALEGPTFRPTPRSLLWEAPQNPEGGILISCNFAIPKILFTELGGFDERFPTSAFEDTEFYARFRASGYSIQFISKGFVRHLLRPIPSAAFLAKRWEGKVIISLDYGASATQILWRLPWHVFRVIQSRFRGQKFSEENVVAGFVFALEWLYVCCWTFRWTAKHRSQPRQEFWSKQVAAVCVAENYGF